MPITCQHTLKGNILPISHEHLRPACVNNEICFSLHFYHPCFFSLPTSASYNHLKTFTTKDVPAPPNHAARWRGKTMIKTCQNCATPSANNADIANCSHFTTRMTQYKKTVISFKTFTNKSNTMPCNSDGNKPHTQMAVATSVSNIGFHRTSHNRYVVARPTAHLFKQNIHLDHTNSYSLLAPKPGHEYVTTNNDLDDYLRQEYYEIIIVEFVFIRSV